MSKNGCLYFGKPLVTGKQFCSCSCSTRYWMKLPPVDLSYPWKKVNQKSYQCRYNEGCICISRDCYRCGWNPEVARRRNMERKEAAV